MTKVRKQKRKKKFRYSVNKKKLKSRRNKLHKIDCEPMKKEWETKKSVIQNLEEMGIVYDPNTTFKIPTTKQLMKPVDVDDVEGNEEENKVPNKHHVADAIEKEAHAPRVRKFELPNSQVEWLTYLMDKYGEDYKAMTRDSKNYEQQTWKQIRAKINRFKSIPEQYGKYLEKKGIQKMDCQ
ncbi:nucleolar protein 16 [Bacillus rossius redtenbacheri]|uniref:nucleolar protein 16 n=1 Tax=Bacillus rossius redtenbacheri TaxID=93214 RepID=UPI002FDC8561